MHVGSIDLEKMYGRVMRIYDVSGKLLNGIKSMYVTSLTCVRAQGVRANVSGLTAG